MEAPETDSRNRFYLLDAKCLITIFSVISLYNIITFNRFFPITEGWFSSYATLILNGKIPYKDFYLFLPPLYPLIMAGIISVVGPKIIFLRVIGVALILLISAGLYLIYARFFNRVAASVAAIVCTIYYQSGVAHITYDFTQFMTACAVYTTLLIIINAESTLRFKRCQNKRQDLNLNSFMYILLAGLLCSFTVMIKHSNGSLIFTFSCLAVALSTWPTSTTAMIKSTALFFTGFCLGIIPVFMWLFRYDALQDFYAQVFTGSINAKGSLPVILFSWIPHLLTLGYFVQLKKVAILLLFLGYWRIMLGKLSIDNKESRLSRFALPLIFILFSLAILMPLTGNTQLLSITSETTTNFYNQIIVIATATSAILFFYYSFKILYRRSHPAWIIIPTMSLGLIFGNGTSAGLSEVGAFLGFGLFLCYIFSIRSPLHIGKLFFLLLSLSLVMFLANKKYSSPYSWWYINTADIQYAKYSSDIPILEGLRLPEKTVYTFGLIDELIRENTSSDDAILAFPHMPIFYLLANRWTNVKAVVHWPDFLPDKFAEKEARELLDNPPKMIIFAELPETVWLTHEILFRAGHPSGQRLLLEAIKKLTSNKEIYSLKKMIVLSDDVRLKIWIRIL